MQAFNSSECVAAGQGPIHEKLDKAGVFAEKEPTAAFVLLDQDFVRFGGYVSLSKALALAT